MEKANCLSGYQPRSQGLSLESGRTSYLQGKSPGNEVERIFDRYPPTPTPCLFSSVQLLQKPITSSVQLPFISIAASSQINQTKDSIFSELQTPAGALITNHRYLIFNWTLSRWWKIFGDEISVICFV